MLCVAAFDPKRTISVLFDHLVGSDEQSSRNIDAQRFGGLQFDEHLDPGERVVAKPAGKSTTLYFTQSRAIALTRRRHPLLSQIQKAGVSNWNLESACRLPTKTA
jgi:hypothetical protein